MQLQRSYIMAGITLSLEHIDTAQAAIQQAIGIASIAGATGEADLPDDALPFAMWAITDLLKKAMVALNQHTPEDQAQ
jgi:hypothetical protein